MPEKDWMGIIQKYMKNQRLPLYIRIYQGIKEYALSESSKDGEQIPTIRAMAEKLRLNNGTVARAYGKLKEEGWIYTKTGKGTFLRHRSGEGGVQANTRNAMQWIHEEECRKGRTEKFINFASSTPSPDLFPVESFKHAINQVLDRDGGWAFIYHEGQGYYPLRERLCRYIKSHGIIASPSDIQVTT